MIQGVGYLGYNSDWASSAGPLTPKAWRTELVSRHCFHFWSTYAVNSIQAAE